MKKNLLAFLCAAAALPCFAKISFGNADINKNDEVLFTVNQDMAGSDQYRSLFYARLVNGEAEKPPLLLTCYPEQMELLDGGAVLQLRNRYGTGRYDSRTSTFSWVEVASDIPVNALPIIPYHASPDGKWLCKIEKDSLVSGQLVLQNVATGKTAVLCDEVALSYDKLPVKWAPDSSILIYEKGDSVYFCNPDAVMRRVEMDEKYRRLGRGSINSVNWANSRYMIYIDDYLIYQINSKELYTLGLYSGIIGQGKAIGRLPMPFNSSTDKFSVNSNASGFVLVQKDRLFTYLTRALASSSVDYLNVVCSRPYTDSSASLVDSYIFWTSDNRPVLWEELLPYNGSGEKGIVYKLGSVITQALSIEDSGRPFVSPDGKKVAFFAGAAIYVYDMDTWQREGALLGEKVTSALWVNKDSLYVGGDRTVKLWNLLTNTCEPLVLASASAGYWDGSAIVADTGGGVFYRYNASSGTWSSVPVPGVRQSVENGRYRVFTGVTQNKLFENALYIRSLSRKTVTKPMYESSTRRLEDPARVLLAFDAYDNADGLSRILSVLKKYKAPAVFFFNGEFIRRYPSETRQIVLNGYDAASMFFSTTDLVNNEFIVDEDFIRRGLARNEDEFFDCTGKELTLYWHAPYFSVSPGIISYAENAGYSYIHSWQKDNDSELLSSRTRPESLIQDYCDSVMRTNGGVIPITVGFSQGNRDNPLYNYLDLLICALIDSGFELVRVNEFSE